MHTTEAVEFSKVVVQQIIPTANFFRKRDKSGNVINKYPGMYAVICHYKDNPRYVFMATEKELAQLQVVTPERVAELEKQVSDLRDKVASLTKKGS